MNSSCQVQYELIDFKLMVQMWRKLDIKLAKDILIKLIASLHY